ncbi:MAG: hypothetical protein ACW7DZ_04835, partial [Paraglaciecola chathamensis]
EKNKVSFESFQGVSPRSFKSFFLRLGNVKDKLGNALEHEEEGRLIITQQFLKDYPTFEKMILLNITEKLASQ